jgi:type 1 glutamine amidotransferase
MGVDRIRAEAVLRSFQQLSRMFLPMLVAGMPWFIPSLAQAAHHVRGPDCPLAFQPYSSDTVLIDLLINPATRTVLTRDNQEFALGLNMDSLSTTVPTFTAIVTPRSLTARSDTSDSALAKLDQDLAAIPVDARAAEARCARYDEAPPHLPRTLKSPAILVFSKVTGFRHNSVDTALVALKDMSERMGWAMLFTDNAAVFNSKDLRRFNAVIWNNVSGDALTVPQERAFKDYIERGGGFTGFHGSGGDPVYVWSWYADTLVGARFMGHPAVLQAARVVIDDPTDAIVRGLNEWTMSEEWYSFRSSPRLKGAHILATLDESSYSPVSGQTDLHMGDHPIAWTQCIGNGRSFYMAIGHQPESYAEPHTLSLLERGIAWTAGLGETLCRGGHEVTR